MTQFRDSSTWRSLILLAAAFIALAAVTEGSTGTPKIPQQRRLASTLKGLTEGLGTTRDIPGYMLPTSLSPVHQLVRLQPFINGNFSFNGYTELTFFVNSATTNITIHMYKIEVDTASVDVYEAGNPPGPSIPIVDQTYDLDKKFYTADLGQTLEAGLTYVLTMSYVGQLNGSLSGFYLSSYTDSNGTEKYLAVTQFEATDARNAFPCFDEPSFKANFTTEIIREEYMTAISNMPLASSEPMPGQPGWIWDKFETSVIMSTYLNAYLVSDFSQKNSTINDLLLRVWAQDELIDLVDYSLSVGHNITFFYESYFNVPYVLPKQDMVAVPDFLAGAMENWGLITYAADRLLYQPDMSSADDKREVCSIVAHEMAHMWFGNLVTLEWWDYAWLNEGFASYYAYLGCEAAEPTFDHRDYFLYTDVHYALNVDDMESSHPVVVIIDEPDNIMSYFDSIVYSKGGSILRMMEYFLTEATHVRGLENYLNQFAFDNVDQDDLFQALTDQGHADGTLRADLTVKEIMDTWTLQMGYPVLTVDRSNNDGTATLSQERFLMRENPNSTDTNDYKWWIPVSYTTQGNANFDQFNVDWMSPNETSKVLSGVPTQEQWMIFNVQEGGFFRVNYDTANWNAISSQLTSDHTVIHVLNRAQILNDAYNLAKAGLVLYDVAFGVTAYLGSDVEYLPLKTSLNELEYILKMFRQESGYGMFKSYTMSIIEPIYNDVGFDDSVQDPFIDQVRREAATFWACGVGYEPCLTSSTSLYSQWMANPNDYTIISPNIKNAVYCTGIAEGTVIEWDFAFDRYLNATLEGERDKLINAMGCSKEGWILERYLDMAFNAGSGIDTSDVSDVMSAVSSNVLGENTAWDYILDNDVAIAQYMGSNQTLASYVNIVSTNFNTDKQLEELEDYKVYYEENFSPNSGSIDDAIEGTELNILWMDSYYDTIFQWLLDNGY